MCKPAASSQSAAADLPDSTGFCPSPQAVPPQPGGQQLHVGLPGGPPRELRGRGSQASTSYSVGDPGWQRACQTSRLPFVSL